jgi:hypothetical protein
MIYTNEVAIIMYTVLVTFGLILCLVLGFANEIYSDQILVFVG